MQVYGARNIFTGKLYIGSTNQGLKTRRWKHESRSRDWSYDRPLYRDMRRLGTDSFRWWVIATCASKADARALEAELIKLLGTAEDGYNIAIDGGSNCGGHSSLKTRQKSSERVKEWWKTHPGIEKTWRKRRSWRAIMEPNKALALSLRAQGKSQKQISRLLDCHQTTVSCAFLRWDN